MLLVYLCFTLSSDNSDFLSCVCECGPFLFLCCVAFLFSLGFVFKYVCGE
jgi:hypothetical protein